MSPDATCYDYVLSYVALPVAEPAAEVARRHGKNTKLGVRTLDWESNFCPHSSGDPGKVIQPIAPRNSSLTAPSGNEPSSMGVPVMTKGVE